MANNTFNDSEYIQNVFGDTVIDEKRTAIQKAFEQAHDVRKFEIELFWKRGTYYWAFILASFTAYFAAVNKFLACSKLTYETLAGLSYFSKFVLAGISFLCFFFCLSWVLVNKGSKFWQKNWESHIDVLEEYFSGKLYHTILNTEHSDFKKCPLRKEAYDYSVTKVTTVGSVVLMCVAALLCLFHVWLLFADVFKDTLFEKITGIVCIALMIFAVVMLMKCVGNLDKKATKSKKEYKEKTDNDNKGKWRQID